MSQGDVLKCIEGKLPPPAVSGNDLKWTMNGSAFDPTANSNYTAWTASLHFAHGRLEEIGVECDY